MPPEVGPASESSVACGTMILVIARIARDSVDVADGGVHALVGMHGSEQPRVLFTYALQKARSSPIFKAGSMRRKEGGRVGDGGGGNSSAMTPR